jgi:hypothetical protein
MAREHSGCEVWQQDFLHSTARRPLRRRLRQRVAVPRAEPGTAARAAPALRDPEAERRPVQPNPRSNNDEGWATAAMVPSTISPPGAVRHRGRLRRVSHYYRPPGLPRPATVAGQRLEEIPSRLGTRRSNPQMDTKDHKGHKGFPAAFVSFVALCVLCGFSRDLAAPVPSSTARPADGPLRAPVSCGLADTRLALARRRCIS